MREDWQRPQTAAEVCAGVDKAETFGRNVRDWQHELQKVTSRPAFASRVSEPPKLLRHRLKDGGQCDAYLAAYVEWLSDRAGIEAPKWVFDPKRTADRPWFDHPPLWAQSFVVAPGAFRRRGVFTKPDNVLRIHRGRPPVSSAERRRKNAERQRRYRENVKAKLAKLKEIEAENESLKQKAAIGFAQLDAEETQRISSKEEFEALARGER